MPSRRARRSCRSHRSRQSRRHAQHLRRIEEAANWFTPSDKEQLHEAAHHDSVFVWLYSPILIPTLKAIKQNPHIKSLEINICSYSMRSSEVRGIAEILAASATLTTICFLGEDVDARTNPTFFKSEASDDDFILLVEAIAASSSLMDIRVWDELPVMLEAAIIEGLRRKTTLTNLTLTRSSLIMGNPSHFADMLAAGKGLGCLDLTRTECGDIDGTSLRDGLRTSQSLTAVKLIYQDDVTICHVAEGLDGNESMEELYVQFEELSSMEMSLLNKVISNHKKLESLFIHSGEFDIPDACDGLCDAVSRSGSITKLECGFWNSNPNHSFILALSRMLQQTTSLQHLRLSPPCFHHAIDELVVGLKACKTLTTLGMYGLDLDTARSLLDVVISNPSITMIEGAGSGTQSSSSVSSGGSYYRQDEDDSYYEQDVDDLETTEKELDFYVTMNKHGRSLEDFPASVWPYALETAGSLSHLDALYFFLQETPQIVMVLSSH